MNDKRKKTFAGGLCFDKIIWIFLVSCVVGYCVEEIWCYIRHGFFESRQALVYGPLSVAYGLGAVVLTLALYKFKDASTLKIFFISYITGTITEYICSLGMEICFGAVAWDYSNVPLNINGRVCLLYSLFWGLLGLFWIKIIYPFMSKWIEKIPFSVGKVLTIAFVIFFIYDSILSASAGLRMDQRDKGIPARNSFEEYLDNRFDDDTMHKIYANSVEVEK